MISVVMPLHSYYLNWNSVVDFHNRFLFIVEVCSLLTHQNDPLSETSESTSYTNDQDSEEVKRVAQQQELLMAYQRAVAERDTALQHLQLRVIELERQLNCANQNGAASANITSSGE